MKLLIPFRGLTEIYIGLILEVKKFLYFVVSKLNYIFIHQQLKENRLIFKKGIQSTTKINAY